VETGADGDGTVLDRLHVELRIDLATRQILAVDEIDVGGSAGGALDHLVELTAGSGLVRHLGEHHPDEQARRTLLYSTLEDLGGAILVSGYALLYTGAIPSSPEFAAERVAHQADICIGWATGSPLLETMRDDGVAACPVGPSAPDLTTEDPLGWHPMAPLEHPTVRRRRRLDVTPADGPGRVLQSHFRDSFASADDELVMHEYLLDVAVDPDGIVEHVTVAPLVLPWYECPGAAASAQQAVGAALDDLPARVRADFVGPSTCTHLNSSLRCLADASALVPTTD
jgi:hypothetical protein